MAETAMMRACLFFLFFFWLHDVLSYFFSNHLSSGPSSFSAFAVERSSDRGRSDVTFYPVGGEAVGNEQKRRSGEIARER